MFQKYNAGLRGSPNLRDAPEALTRILKELCLGNAYATTLHCINSAIVKLSKLTVSLVTRPTHTASWNKLAAAAADF